MATNLVSLVMEFLTPDMIRRIANGLGLDTNKVQSAMGAAVPGLLAGLSSVATEPDGPQKLVDAAKQETGTLGNLADLLGKGDQSSIIARGSQLLGSLLGGRDQSALTEAIGRFTGLGQGTSGSLLGLLTPIVMGAVAKQPGSLNPSGMASLLASQKNSIAAALPPAFRNMLGGTGLLDSLGGAARDAAGAANQAGRYAGSAVYTAGNASQRAVARGASSATNWLWLIPAAAIVAGLVYWFNRPGQQEVHQQVASAQNLTVGGVDIGKQTTDNLSSLRTTLSGVTDVESAKEALPKLQEVTGQINKTEGMIGSLSPEQRKILAEQVNPAMPAVNQLFNKVLAIPGVEEVLKPTIDNVKAKLATMTV